MRRKKPTAAFRRLEDKQYKPLHALFLVQRGKQEQGVAELRKLAARDPSDRALRTHLIAALLETGKGAEAEQLLAGVLKRNSKDTDALMQRSALYLREGRAVEAQRDLQQVLQVQPDSAEAHRFMARTFKSQGQWQNERLELIESLKLRQDLLQARLGLARNYINANEPKVALQVLNEAPEQQRKQLPLLIERNWALLAANDLASLRTSLDSALKNRRDKDPGRAIGIVTDGEPGLFCGPFQCGRNSEIRSAGHACNPHYHRELFDAEPAHGSAGPVDPVGQSFPRNRQRYGICWALGN